MQFRSPLQGDEVHGDRDLPSRRRAVYARAVACGRMLPDGLRYLDSWIDAAQLDRCFQLMATDDPALIDEWIARWADLVAFDVIPVIDSAEAAARLRD